MSRFHWWGYATQVLQSDRQTGALDFPDARPGGQANATLNFRAFLILSL